MCSGGPVLFSIVQVHLFAVLLRCIDVQGQCFADASLFRCSVEQVQCCVGEVACR